MISSHNFFFVLDCGSFQIKQKCELTEMGGEMHSLSFFFFNGPLKVQVFFYLVMIIIIFTLVIVYMALVVIVSG